MQSDIDRQKTKKDKSGQVKTGNSLRSFSNLVLLNNKSINGFIIQYNIFQNHYSVNKYKYIKN